MIKIGVILDAKITPYYPVPFRKPNKIVRTYEEPFEDRSGNKAMITYADYKDKKGKLVTRFVLWVKWDD